MNTYRIYIFQCILLLLSNSVLANDKLNNHPPELFKENLSIGDFTIGLTSLSDASKHFGGRIIESKDNDGASFNQLCLITKYKFSNYMITLISGALGSWNMLTEYSVDKIDSNRDIANCGDYTKNNISFGWLLFDMNEVINRYGEPKIKKKNYLEYIYKYKDFDSRQNITFDVYSGISFYFDENGKVVKLNVFKVEST